MIKIDFTQNRLEFGRKQFRVYFDYKFIKSFKDHKIAFKFALKALLLFSIFV